MINEIIVDTALLRSDTVKIDEEIRRFKSLYNALLTKGDELNITWKGPSKDEFQNQYKSDCEAIREIGDIFSEIESIMQYSNEQYLKSGQDVSSLIGEINI